MIKIVEIKIKIVELKIQIVNIKIKIVEIKIKSVEFKNLERNNYIKRVKIQQLEFLRLRVI